jgi:hypothetical protein
LYVFGILRERNAVADHPEAHQLLVARRKIVEDKLANGGDRVATIVGE